MTYAELQVERDVQLQQMGADVLVGELEARLPVDAAHLERVSNMAIKVCLGLRGSPLPDELVLEIAKAAKLHDVGKAEEEIARLAELPRLLKPDEAAVVARHTEIGGIMIDNLQVHGDKGLYIAQSNAAHTARYHHHDFDELLVGGGFYPPKPMITAFVKMLDEFDAPQDAERPYLDKDSVKTAEEAAESVLEGTKGYELFAVSTDKIVEAMLKSADSR